MKPNGMNSHYHKRPILLVALSLLIFIISGASLSSCAHEMTEFEKQQIWLEKNYPSSKKPKPKKNDIPVPAETSK